MCFLVSVFPIIERRHFEQVKVAVPGVLKILKSIATETDNEDADIEDLFNKTIGIASSIYTICVKLVGDYCTILFIKAVIVSIQILMLIF